MWANLLYRLARDIGGSKPTDMDDAENYLNRADQLYETTAPQSPSILDAKMYAAWGKLHLLWAEHHCLMLYPDDVEVQTILLYC